LRLPVDYHQDGDNEDQRGLAMVVVIIMLVMTDHYHLCFTDFLLPSWWSNGPWFDYDNGGDDDLTVGSGE